MNNTLYILDTHALIYRAYYAFQKNHLSRSTDNFPTGAIYGMMQYMLSIIEQYRPVYTVACVESDTILRKKEFFPTYKANRSDMPGDLKQQLKYIYNLVFYSGFNICMHPGYEADDVIAAYTHNWLYNVCIFSKDKDLMQLINHNVSMFVPNGTGKFETIGEKDVVAKFGVTPKNLGKFLALTGDTSDNIPGVKGYGPKKAANLVNNDPNSAIFTCDDYVISKRLVNFWEPIVNTDKNTTSFVQKDKLLEIAKEFELKSLIERIEML